MTSTALRPAVAAVTLTLLLGLCAVPAVAQPPLRSATHEKAERGVLPQLWLWLNELWAQRDTPSRMQERSTEGGTPTVSGDGGLSGATLLNRNGTLDPWG
jgi:hypothetical protein